MLILQTCQKLWILEQIALGKPYKIRVLRAGYWEVFLDEESSKTK